MEEFAKENKGQVDKQYLVFGKYDGKKRIAVVGEKTLESNSEENIKKQRHSKKLWFLMYFFFTF
jgi:hypothetical protein